MTVGDENGFGIFPNTQDGRRVRGGRFDGTTGLMMMIMIRRCVSVSVSVGIVVIVCTDDDDDDRDKDKDEANESINPSAVVILESAHLLGRLKRPHRCNIFFSFEATV